MLLWNFLKGNKNKRPNVVFLIFVICNLTSSVVMKYNNTTLQTCDLISMLHFSMFPYSMLPPLSERFIFALRQDEIMG
jgi:hypothetical protein